MTKFLFSLQTVRKPHFLFLVACLALVFAFLPLCFSESDFQSLVSLLLFCCDPRFWPVGYSVILWLIVSWLAVDIIKALFVIGLGILHKKATEKTATDNIAADSETKSPTVSDSPKSRLFRYLGDICFFRASSILVRIFLGLLQFALICTALCVLVYSLPFVFFDSLRQWTRENLAIVDYTVGDYLAVVNMIVVSLWPLFVLGILVLLVILCWYLKKYRTFVLLFLIMPLPASWPILAAENRQDEISPLVLLSHATPENLTPRQLSVITRSFSRPVGPEDGGFLSNQQVISCFDAFSYQYTGGRYVDETFKFRLYQPSRLVAGRKYPLVIWFHGARESDTDNTRQLAHMHSILDLFLGANRQDFYLLATQCPPDNQDWEHSVSSEGKGDAPLTITWEILEHLLAEFPIDRERISLVGICSGGMGALRFLLLYPDVPCAAVVCSSTAPALTTAQAGELTKTTIWAFNNIHEEDAYESMKRFFMTIQQAGGQTHLTPICDETDIHYTWVPALYQWKSVHWLLTQRRGGHHPPPGVLCELHSGRSLFWLFGLPVLVVLVLCFCRRRLRRIAV